MDVLKITLFVVAALFPLFLAVEGNETCEEINIDSNDHTNGFHQSQDIGSDNGANEEKWHNTSFRGGHLQIPFKDDVGDECFRDNGNLIVLTDPHPDITTLTEDIVTLPACSINEARICGHKVIVEARKCGDDLLYRFTWNDKDNKGNDYICIDQVYDKSCDDEETVYFAGNVDGNIIRFPEKDFQVGWFDAFHNGKQFALPLLEQLDAVRRECYQDGSGYYLKDPIPQLQDDNPIRVPICFVSGSYDESNCRYFLYVRSCNGTIQYNLSFMRNMLCDCMCFVHNNNVEVNPEIGHELSYIDDGDKNITAYSPFLQYRCSFDVISDVFYKVNWYINGTLQVQTGPSLLLDDLVFKEEFFKHLPPGYEVQCGVMKMSENETNEILSFVFYAGWKTRDDFVTVSKSGYTVVDVVQTIPVGCYYTEADTDADTRCVEKLTFKDPLFVPEECKGGLRVQNVDDKSKSDVEIQALRNGEIWSSKTHKIRLRTVDNDYDDKTAYDLQMSITESVGHGNQRSTNTKVVGNIPVDVKDNKRHLNKRGYTHVDPHMKTIDGT